MPEPYEAPSVGEDFPIQQARVREVLTQYDECHRNVPGSNCSFACSFAILLVKQSLKEAEKAMASGDIVRILHAYEDLKGIE